MIARQCGSCGGVCGGGFTLKGRYRFCKQEVKPKIIKQCSNCIFCDEVKERIIYCERFEQYMPIEIGKCDKWEQLR